MSSSVLICSVIYVLLFHIRIGKTKVEALSLLHLNFSLDCDIREVQERDMNWTPRIQYLFMLKMLFVR
jgi:hypothetical protein